MSQTICKFFLVLLSLAVFTLLAENSFAKSLATYTGKSQKNSVKCLVDQSQDDTLYMVATDDVGELNSVNLEICRKNFEGGKVFVKKEPPLDEFF